MPDQATDLRELVRQCAEPDAPRTRPRHIVVGGGKGGTGTTTIAVQLAVALAHCGVRTLLVDGSGSGDAALLCRLDPRYTLADVLYGGRTVDEALQIGPGGVLVLPGMRVPGPLADAPPAALDRLLSQLDAFGPRAEVIVVDAGNAPSRTARRFWQAADLVLVVTTPMAAAVMGAYAAIKLLAASGSAAPLHLLVNMAVDVAAAEDAYQRLEQACRRFLARSLTSAGLVPVNGQIDLPPRGCAEATAADCGDSVSLPIHRLARTLLENLAAGAEARREETRLCRAMD